jgi:hypothetical protein
MPPTSIAEGHAAPAALVTTLVRFGHLAAAGAIAAAVLLLVLAPYSPPPITEYYLVVQDAPVLLFSAGFFLLAHMCLRAGLAAEPAWLERRCHQASSLWLTVGAVCVTVYAGTRLVYQDYGLSMDEFMAQFDSTIVAAGQLLASVAPEWRDLVPALQPIFRLPVSDNASWVSSYLPMNAVLRAGFLWLGSPALTGVALAGVSLAVLYGIARRLWPDRPDAAILSVVLLASSAQFLVTAMTPYAMTAHLALNLAWLWLFLRGTWRGHIAAVAVAFVACGLHQVVFHPLFAAPFLASLVLARKWRLACFYGAAYAAIGLFWVLYWSLLLGAAGAAPEQSADVGLTYFLRRIADMVDLQASSLVLMAMNLARFLAWQAPLMLPLALIGALVCRGRSAVLSHLSLGIILTLAAVLVLMPFQGHGWGYRYLHGLLGSFALLAAQGWIWLTDRMPHLRRRLALAMLLSVVASVLVLLPWRLAQVHAFVRPYAAASAAIAGAGADVVLVDASNVWYGVDLVRNDPFLRGSPKVLNLASLQVSQVADICSRYRVAIFDGADASRLGLRRAPGIPPNAVVRAQGLREVMRRLGCGTEHVVTHSPPRP